MKLDSLKKFVSLRESLQKEKAVLERRLSEINAALGVDASSAGTPAPVVRKKKAGAKGPRAKGARHGNTLSLRDAVVKATTEKPLTKEEILKAVDKLGYTFKTKNPLASVNVVLYSKKQFKQVDGKFSPAK